MYVINVNTKNSHKVFTARAHHSLLWPEATIFWEVTIKDNSWEKSSQFESPEIRPIRKSTRGGAIFKNGYRPAGKPTRGGAISYLKIAPP